MVSKTNTLFVGKVYERFDELHSTNDWAAELIAKSKPAEGTVVRADTQTAGRGQFGSRWMSPPGQNLLLSVILYPHWLAVQDQFYLSMAVALALHDTISRPACTVKWPNDVYLGDKKTAGILIQNTLSGASIQTSVVGIGLNVNQITFDPALPNPTSLAAFTGATFGLDVVMVQLFECLEQRYLQLKSGRLAEIKSDYEAILYRRNERSRFVRTADGCLFDGTILGVAPSGHLRVDVANEGVSFFDLKEIRLG
jgi:BirA family biotin operon repressor/biotin-[acetyl-CoA-carboxylase] ligase